MKILVIGSTGNIGAPLFKYLNYWKDHNYQISGISSEDINLLNKKECIKYFKNISYYNTIIFLVGLAHKKGKKKDINEFYDYNCKSIINLYLALEEHDKVPDKFIFASSVSVYGENINECVYNEDTLKSPISPYAITKLQAEDFIINNIKSKIWILRLASCYSEDFLLNIKRRIKLFNIIYRVGKGKNKLSLCNVENINKVISNIVENNIPEGIYNICDNKKYSYDQLINWSKRQPQIIIPKNFIYFIYLISRLIKNIFLYDNSIKLISDNVVSNHKIRKYIELDSDLYQVKLKNDI